MKKYFVILFAIFSVTQKSVAQEIPIDILLTLQLPPIDSLFEGAKKSSMVEFYNYRMEGQELNLKTERRSWLGYFSIFATYQYGVMGMNSFTDLGVNFPIIYQNSGGQQIWYNVGGAVRIPLESIFDRRNRIKMQQLKIKETIKERDMWYDTQKSDIIELYNKAQKALNTLKLVTEQATLSSAQYDISQKDYILGKSTAQALSTAKSMQVQSFVQKEELRSELNTVLLQLEIISNIKIINKK